MRRNRYNILKDTLLILVSILVLSKADGQSVTFLTGFDNTAFGKGIHNIVKLNDNTCLILLTNPKMLWRSDGTKDGTYLLHNWESETGNDGGVFCNILGVVNGLQIMLIATKTEGKEIWVSDGTVSGTHLLVDFIPGALGLVPKQNTVNTAVNYDSVCYFIIKDDLNFHLMKTNGTVSGTEIYMNNLATIETGVNPPQMPSLFEVNGFYYFIYYNKLYKIDYKSKSVQKIDFQACRELVDAISVNDSTILFATNDNFDGSVYSFNLNTNVRTQLIETYHFFDYGTKYIYYGVIRKFNEFYYVVANDENDDKLYKTDGTTAGTKVLSILGSKIESFIDFDNKLWYDNMKNSTYGIYSLDASDDIKLELNSGNFSGGGRRGFRLLDNGKFFSSGNYVQTGSDYEPHIFDPVLKSVTKIANLHSFIGSFPELLTYLKPKEYLFYATDDVNNGSLYHLKLNTTDTDEERGSFGFVVYPNPSYDSWVIKSKQDNISATVWYKLVDPVGLIVKEGSFNNVYYNLDSSNLNSGLYFLQLEHANFTEIIKLIKI